MWHAQLKSVSGIGNSATIVWLDPEKTLKAVIKLDSEERFNPSINFGRKLTGTFTLKALKWSLCSTASCTS